MPVPSGLSARRPIPAVYQRAMGNAARLEVWDETIQAPSAGTYRLRALDGSTLADGPIAIAADGAATFAILAPSLPATLTLGAGYMEQWTLTIDGDTSLIERPVILARQALLCPVSPGDIYALYADIDRIFGGLTDTGVMRFIRTAWGDVLRRLLSDGVWPERIIDIDALFDPCRNRAMFHLFSNLALSSPERYGTVRDHYLAQYDSSWSLVRYRQDTTGDGMPDSDERNSVGRIVSRGTGPLDWRSRRRVF